MSQQQPPKSKKPILLEEPDREENLLKAEALIAEKWEGLAGTPMTPKALNCWALSLLEIAETWERAQILVDKVRTGCERRPAPIEMRRIYCDQIGPPADGVSDWDADQSKFMGGFKKKAED